MAEKTTVAILSGARKHAVSVCKKINESRPVECKAYWEINTFFSGVMEDPPDLIVVSMDFVHPNISNFCSIFKSATGRPTLACCESTKPKSYKAVQNARADYKIHGKLTAHNLWSKITLMLKSQEEVFEKEEKRRGAGKKQEQNMRVTGGAGKQESANVKGSQFKNGKTKVASKGMNPANLAKIMEQLEDAPGGSGNENPRVGAGDRNQDREDLKNSLKTDDASGTQQAKGHFDGDPSGAQVQKGTSGKLETQVQKGNAGQGGSHIESGSRANSVHKDSSGSESMSSLGGNTRDSSQRRAPESGQGDPGISGPNEKKKNQRDTPMTILEQACRSAAEDVFMAHKETTRFDKSIERLSAFVFSDGEVKGYLLLALQSGEEISAEKEAQWISSLESHLAALGGTSTIKESVSLTVAPVDFYHWSKMRGRFRFCLQTESQEGLCLSFLDFKKVLPPYSETADGQHITVNMQHIPPSTNVTFDAFIFLPLNEKYVRLLKKNRSLCLNQIKRFLKNKSTQNLMIPIEEKENFIEFYIQNRLRWELIASEKEDAA